MKALYFFKPHPLVRVYKDGLRLENPSHSLPSYLSLPFLTSCTTPTSKALSSQGATGAAMATLWGTVLAVAMVAPTLQWAMALAMATMAVGLTEDTGHTLSTDVLWSPWRRLISSWRLSGTSRFQLYLLLSSSLAHQPLPRKLFFRSYNWVSSKGTENLDDASSCLLWILFLGTFSEAWQSSWHALLLNFSRPSWFLVMVNLWKCLSNSQ